MANVLTLQNKRGLQREVLFRFVGVLATFVSAVFLCGSALLLPKYISSRNANAVVVSVLKNLPSVEQNKNDQGKYLKILEEAIKNRSVFKTVKDISETQANFSGSIIVTRFVFEKNPKENKFEISGVAKDRDTLVEFVSKLRATESARGAKLPVSTLASAKDLVFTISVPFSL